MNYVAYIAWIPLLPLASFVLLGVAGRTYIHRFSGILGTLVLLAVTVLSLLTAYHYFFVDGMVNGAYRSLVPWQYTWLRFSKDVSIDMGMLLDPISVMMMAVVSVVSLMVHIFSLGYMKGEERYSTYYAFLSLFTFSMLGLVAAENIFQTYFFWELVGISSFLLIGFYYDRPAAVAASKKAFIVTRFADLGFLVGILVLSFHGGTLDFRLLIDRLSDPVSPERLHMAAHSFMGISALTWGLTLVFIGGAGKSAMFPLHVWLPDAMEGPTPVSALIHAATMVVAGVYLVARLFRVFATDLAVMDLIAYVGALSALLAAIIACSQTDIKRVLAYSTMSQIGYMMFALGVSVQPSPGGGLPLAAGFTASMFHLFTHAFFKSLLFLCAGCVIHVVHSNEMGDMGGLRKQMPVTHIAFLVACLAIAGIPPFSGFFSKEAILSAAYESNKLIYLIGLVTSMLTAFYMFRLYFRIFHYQPQTRELHPGERIGSMKLPLVFLAICATLAGWVPFSSFITFDGVPRTEAIDIRFSILPVTLSLGAILLAAKLYRTRNELPAKIASALGPLYQLASNKFYIDEAYLFFTKKIIFNLVGQPAAWIDKNIVDGSMNLLATATEGMARSIRKFQSGKVQDYALYFFGGIAGLAVLFIYLLK